ncbi:MAG: Sjogren's syndrome/scleroderma autoantigen 1 family protein [Desulfurococcaceae archaeon]
MEKMTIENRKVVEKKMAELLKTGAAMLAQKCPVEGCYLPLFKLKTGEVICPEHGRVYIVKSDEEAKEVASRALVLKVLEDLEGRVIDALSTLPQHSIDEGYRDVIGWLEVLERIMRIKKELFSEEGKSKAG